MRNKKYIMITGLAKHFGLSEYFIIPNFFKILAETDLFSNKLYWSNLRKQTAADLIQKRAHENSDQY